MEENKTKPKISVIVPVYNVEKYLRRCVDSILAQTFTDFEVLLIDDGSKDSSGSICDEYAEKDSRVSVFHKENGGVSSARNLGLYNAKGTWICFVDSDDIISKYYLQMFEFAVNNNDVYIAASGYTNNMDDFPRENELTNLIVVNTKDFLDRVLSFDGYGGDGYLWNKIFNKDLIRSLKLSFDTDISLWEDLLFVIQYCKSEKKMALFSEKIYFYRENLSSAVHNITSKKIRDKISVCIELKLAPDYSTSFYRRLDYLLYCNLWELFEHDYKHEHTYIKVCRTNLSWKYRVRLMVKILFMQIFHHLKVQK